MPIPVLIPGAPLTITDEDTRRAESLVEALIGIMKNGSTGTALTLPVTDATTIPNVSNPDELIAFEAKTAEQQLYLRQTAIAFVKTLVKLANAHDIGVSRLSSDPANPAVPTALNAEEVKVSPTENAVPRARADGTLHPGWVTGGASGGSPVNDAFTATCAEEIATGDIVFIAGPDRVVDVVDITNSAKIPAIGIVVSKESVTECTVQSSGLVAGIFSGLTPNAQYFVAEDSTLTMERPHGTDADPVFVVPLGYAIDDTVFLLRPTTIVKVRS